MKRRKFLAGGALGAGLLAAAFADPRQLLAQPLALGRMVGGTFTVLRARRVDLAAQDVHGLTNDAPSR